MYFLKRVKPDDIGTGFPVFHDNKIQDLFKTFSRLDCMIFLFLSCFTNNNKLFQTGSAAGNPVGKDNRID